MLVQSEKIRQEQDKFPLVSVIIPVFNGEKFIAAALDSLQKQKYKNLEIIVVDDCSKDHTADICRKYSQKDSRIMIYTQDKNRGVAAARNIALFKATGEYIAFLDADDMMDSEMLFVLLMIIIQKRCDLVMCNFDRVYDENKSVLDQSVTNQVEEMTTEDLLQQMLLDQRQGYIWNKLFRRDILQENKIVFDENLSILEDFKFLMDYFEHSQKVCYTGKVLYHYHMEKSSISRRKMNPSKFSLYTGSCEIYERIKHVWPKMTQAGNHFYMNTNMGLLYDCYQNSRENRPYIDKIKNSMKLNYDAKLMNKKNKVKYILSMYIPPIYCLCKR